MISDLFGVSSPGLGPVPRAYFKGVQTSTSPSLPKKQGKKLVDFFQNILSSGADPSRIAFEASTIGQQFPGERAFQPGGSVFNELLKERLSPSSRKETIADANYLAQTVLGRPMNPDEERYVKKTRDLDAFAGLVFSNPQSTRSAFPTADEDKISAYYGRMIPGEGGFTGKRFSSIAPVEYTGGIS